MSEELVQCPYCGDHPSGTHFHCSLNFEKSVFFCYYCGKGGSLKKLAYDHPEFKERIWLFGDIRVAPARVSGEKPPLQLTKIHSSDGIMAKRALAYLLARGMTTEEIIRTRASVSARLPWYVVFPYDFGEEVFWAARAVAENGRTRWLFPKAGETKATKSEVVWGISSQPRDGDIWLCEGVFDAVAVRGVAVFGKATSSDQLRMIMSLNPKRVVIAFDKDARADAVALQNILRQVVPTAVIPPQFSHKDYGDLLRIGWRRPI